MRRRTCGGSGFVEREEDDADRVVFVRCDGCEDCDLLDLGDERELGGEG